MAEIKWTNEASKWLQNIFDYISEDNPLAAQRVIEGIYNKTQILKSFPEIGYRYRKEPEGEVRVLLYGHYRIAYFVKKNLVEILGIFHGSLEIEKFLSK